MRGNRLLVCLMAAVCAVVLLAVPVNAQCANGVCGAPQMMPSGYGGRVVIAQPSAQWQTPAHSQRQPVFRPVTNCQPMNCQPVNCQPARHVVSYYRPPPSSYRLQRSFGVTFHRDLRSVVAWHPQRH